MTRRSSSAAAKAAATGPTTGRARRAVTKASPTKEKAAPAKAPAKTPPKRGRGRPAAAKPAEKSSVDEKKPAGRPARGARSSSSVDESPPKPQTSAPASARSTSRRGAAAAPSPEPPAKRVRKPPRKLSPEPEVPKPRAKSAAKRASSVDADDAAKTTKKGGRGRGRTRAEPDNISSGSDNSKQVTSASVRRGWGRRPKPPPDENGGSAVPAPEPAPKAQPQQGKGSRTVISVSPAKSSSPVELAPAPEEEPLFVPSVVEEMKPKPGAALSKMMSSRQMVSSAVRTVVPPPPRVDIRPSEIPERGRPPKNSKSIDTRTPIGDAITSLAGMSNPTRQPNIMPPKRGRPRKTPLPVQPIGQPAGKGRGKAMNPVKGTLTQPGRAGLVKAIEDGSPGRKRKLGMHSEETTSKRSRAENGNVHIVPQLNPQYAHLARKDPVTTQQSALSVALTTPSIPAVEAPQKVVQLTKQQQDQLTSTSQVQIVQDADQKVVLMSPKPVTLSGESAPRVQLIQSPNNPGPTQIRLLSPGQMPKSLDQQVRMVLPSSPGGGATKVTSPQFKVVQVSKPSSTQVTKPQAGQRVLVKSGEGMKVISVKPGEGQVGKPTLVIPAEKSPTGQPIRLVHSSQTAQATSPVKVVQANPLGGNVKIVSSNKGSQPTVLTQEQAVRLLNQAGQNVKLVQQQPGSPIKLITVTKPSQQQQQQQQVRVISPQAGAVVTQALGVDRPAQPTKIIVTKAGGESPTRLQPSILKQSPTRPQQIIVQKSGATNVRQVATTQSLLQGIQSGSKLSGPVKIVLPGPQRVVTLPEETPAVEVPPEVSEEIVEEEIATDELVDDSATSREESVSEPVQQHDEPDMDDYVMVDMADVPSLDSAEVQAAEPTHAADILTSRTFVKNVRIVESSINKDYTFSIASYNILADCHMRALGDAVYPDLDDTVLSQQFRHERLMKELEYLSADVVCLQECGDEYYSKTLEPTMKGLGYSGVFKKREGDQQHEGEATFYRTSRFTVVHTTSIALKDLSDQLISQCALDESTKSAIRQYLTSGEVILITKLRCNHTMKELTVGNVHVQWTEYKRLDLQCIQVACAVKELVNVAGGSNNAYVLCGDFNAQPDMAPYQLAMDGYLNDHSIDKLKHVTNVTMPDGATQSLVDLWWQGFKHTSPNLQSAYLTVKGSEPGATVVDSEHRSCECVDYILCSPQAIQILGVLECPAQFIADHDQPLPNSVFPSNHLSLKAKLAFK